MRIYPRTNIPTSLKDASCRGKARSQAGFTLFEMMVVVSIVAVVAALAAPSIGDARADARGNEFANNLVRTLRSARSSSAGYGRAHLAVYDPIGAGGEGSLQVFRGINNRCNTNNWIAITAAGCGGGAATPMCVESIGNDDFEVATSSFRLSMPDFPAGVQVCFEPTGITRWRRTPVARFTADNADAAGSTEGAFVFEVQRHTDGEGDVGVERRVVLPLGGDARVQR